MSTAKAIVVALAVSLAIGATTAAPASAHNWMLNGKTLFEESLLSAPLKNVARIDAPIVIAGGGMTVECIGNLEIKSGIIAENFDKLEYSSIIFTACKAKPPCTVPVTIGTVPVEDAVTVGGAPAVKGVIKPQSGSVITTIKVGGEEAGCAAAGNKPLEGDAETSLPKGQEERTDQLYEFNQEASPLLKLGSSPADFTGAALLLLENRAAWSFL